MQEAPLDRFGRLGDMILAFGVIAIVGMMVVPLPTALLDLLLSVNISAAVVLVLVSLYVPGAVRLSTFPSILLLTTLFRLALNVSSTRLILLQADAGAVIDAFGEFVVRGNYVVGAVVFAILTLIQFIVVARGAERVSEVAARFTLDAMPGRQMAIDSDLRAEVITMDEARRQRSALQRESQLFGALDGAMKFVKGDAIAAVVIIAINVTAGMLIGVVQLGMSASEALETYTLLTVGDGLVSQIPALLIATAAGIIVTRVHSESERPLGDEIARQLVAYPRALGLAGVLLIALALVPGLPTVPFAVVGIALAVVGRFARQSSSATPAGTVTAAVPMSVPPINRLELHISEALEHEIEADRETYEAGIRRLRQELVADLGISVSPPRLLVRDSGPRNVGLCIDEVPMARGEVPAVGGVDHLIRWCGSVLRQHAEQFVDLQTTRNLLDAVEAERPALVALVVPGVISVAQLTDVLRRLVAEDVSIRNLARILDLIAADGAGSHDTHTIVDIVREGLSHYLADRFADADHRLRFFEVDRGLEDMVIGAVRTSGQRTYLALGAKLTAEIVDGIAEQTLPARSAGRRPILVTEQPARSHLRALIRSRLPDVVVLARQELAASVDCERVGWISV